MANKSLFSSANSQLPSADVLNKAGGPAYQLKPKHALAQMAATGCFNGVFYANAKTQLGELIELINKVDDNEFLAKLAVYSRKRAYMKDMPAAILVALSTRDNQLTHQIFDQVVDNGRMLRTVFQMVRSGQFGRKSLSSSLKRAFQRWLNEASVNKLVSASIGKNPSLRDVMRMARPKPADNARRALFGWLTQKEVDKWAPATITDLPESVQALMAFRRSESADAQTLIAGELQVRWDLLADSVKGPSVWKAIARQMGPQALRMNLNTLTRHEVFKLPGGGIDNEMVDYVAGRLSNVEEIQRARQFPYQYFAAYLNAGDVPQKIKSALHSAAEIACGNVPELPGPIVIGLDTSGSMNSPATGRQGRGATSKMRCVDVASVFASAILRRNPDSVVIPFDTRAYKAKLDPGDTILSLASRLSKYGGGGTNCSLPLKEANKLSDQQFAGIVLVSDNESWVGNGRRGSTGVMTEWNKFAAAQKKLAKRNGDDSISPKLVCIDIQPYGDSQAVERDDILNVGGFSDAVFNVVSSFLSNDESRFVSEVEAIEI